MNISHKIKVLSLYRSIFKLHKVKLNELQLYLGNEYVRNEFKLHKTAKNPMHISQFMNEWENYLSILKNEKEISKELTNEEKNNLTEEQKKQLEKLKEETLKLYKKE
jgi:hypothetical protein